MKQTNLVFFWQSSDMRVDASFIATFLETVSIVVMYYAWADMTKGDFFERGGGLDTKRTLFLF